MPINSCGCSPWYAAAAVQARKATSSSATARADPGHGRGRAQHPARQPATAARAALGARLQLALEPAERWPGPARPGRHGGGEGADWWDTARTGERRSEPGVFSSRRRCGQPEEPQQRDHGAAPNSRSRPGPQRPGQRSGRGPSRRRAAGRRRTRARPARAMYPTTGDDGRAWWTCQRAADVGEHAGPNSSPPEQLRRHVDAGQDRQQVEQQPVEDAEHADGGPRGSSTR